MAVYVPHIVRYAHYMAVYGPHMDGVLHYMSHVGKYGSYVAGYGYKVIFPAVVLRIIFGPSWQIMCVENHSVCTYPILYD